MMTYDHFIPARSRSVLELTGKAPDAFQTTRDAFLSIQPDCDYRIAADLGELAGEFDVILAHSPLFDRLDGEPLIGFFQELAAHLKQNGMLICTLANIGYGENLAAILAGRPPFFKTTLTRVELERALAAAAWHPLKATSVFSRVPIDQKLAELAQTDVRVISFVLMAMKDEPPPRTMIQTLMGEAKICAPVRIHMPNAFFVAEANTVVEAYPAGKEYRLYDAGRFPNRIFINQRVIASSFAEGADLFKSMRARGYLCIHEMDDFPFLRWARYENNGWINFIGAHGVQTTTKYLADFFRRLNPNVACFANQLYRLPPARDFDEEARQADRPVTIFFGALNREEDFMEILPALNAVAGRFGDRLAFRIIARREIFDAVESKNKIYVGNVNVFAGQLVSYEEYQAAIRRSDIALLPLRDTQLNRGKSDLKFIECAANGAVVLASPLIYSDVIVEGETGFIYRSEKEFVDKLGMLIENGEKRREVAAAAYRYVRHNRLMSQHYEERLAWYRECLARLPELHAASLARIERGPAKCRMTV